MSEKIDKFYGIINYFILAGILIAYFIYYALSYDKSFVDIISDWTTIVHTAFVIFAQIITISIAHGKSLDDALSHVNFIDANKLNNEIIKFFRQHYEELLNYITKLNKNEREATERDFLFANEVVSVKELNKKQLKRFKKLKPLVYSSKGIIKPIYSKSNKGNRVDYDASINIDGKKFRSMLTKIFTGVLFALLTVQVSIVWNNMGQAFFATTILASGMAITFFFNYSKLMRALTKVAPELVGNKENFYLGFKEYLESKPKNNNIEPHVIPVKVNQPIIVDEDILRQEKKDL